MIFFSTARPRVGKSLYVVYLLEQMKKDKNNKYHFIGNIEGYDFDEVLPHGSSAQVKKELIDYLTNTDWVKKCKEYSEKHGKKLIFAFDECQSFLRAGTIQRSYKEELLYFFEIAGHYGADIYLISQHWKKLDPEIQYLVHEIHKVSQISLPNTLRVKIISPEDWEQIDTKDIKEINKYYDKYITSHTEEGHQKPRTSLNRTLKIIVVTILIVLILLGYSAYKTKNFIDNKKIKATPESQQQKKSNKKQKLRPSNTKKDNLQIAIARLRKEWQHPIATEIFDAINCYKLTNYSYTCTNIPKTPLFDRIFNSSVCTKSICDYTYFDSKKYDDDGHNEYCCLPDGKSLAESSVQTQYNPSSHINDQEQTELKLFKSN